MTAPHALPPGDPADRSRNDPPLSIRLLGGFEVRVHGQPLPPLRSRKERWLLALLALRGGRAAPRDWLAQALWPFPDTLESDAAYNLRRSLSQLRRALGPEAARLQTPTRQTVRLDLDGAPNDVAAFDRAIARDEESSLQEAVALYGGLLLPECTDAWVLPERESRHQDYLRALTGLAARAGARGEHAEAVSLLRRAAAADPQSEATQRALMEALARGGDLNAALSAFQNLCRRLQQDDPRAAPAPETRLLYQGLRDEARRQTRLGPAPVSLPHLPRYGTAMVGRDSDVAEVSALLRRARLLTLTGTGGVGKTRLAVAVAEAMAGGFAGGAWFVDLAPLADGGLVAAAVAAALGVRESPGLTAREAVGEHLKRQTLLLVLDNCEHLPGGCLDLAQGLLGECPGLRILATSRQALGAADEAAWRVPSLPAPDPSRLPAGGAALVEAVNAHAAVRVLVARAAEARGTFALSGANARDVARICARLDGIPLALELAAARLRALSPAQLAARLDDRFRLLTGGDQALLPRQQTLRALIDWSYALLPAPERTLLARLSVFAGGWTVDAAEVVCAAADIFPEDVLLLLLSLVDQSLAVYEEDAAGQGRYRLLETVRQYAADRLRESDEAVAVRHRHRDFFLALAERAEPLLAGPEGSGQLARLGAERDNLRAALDLCLAGDDAEGTQAGLRLTAALCRFWQARGELAEARERLAAALGRPGAAGPTPARARALRWAGLLAYYQGDYAAAQTEGEQALALFAQLGEAQGCGWARVILGNVAACRGEDAGAQLHFEEALALFRAAEDASGAGSTLNNLANLRMSEGDLAGARPFYEEALALQRAARNLSNSAIMLTNLGTLAYYQGDLVEARTRLEESLALRTEIGIRADQSGYALAVLAAVSLREGGAAEARAHLTEGLTSGRACGDRASGTNLLEFWGRLRLAEGRPDRAAWALGAAAALRGASGVTRQHIAQAEYEADAAAVQAALPPTAFAAAWAAGEALTWEQAVDEILAGVG